MKKIWIICVGIAAFASTANASIESRAEEVSKQVQGKHDYHAQMAKELSAIAEEEKGQHEVSTAGAFMEEAEKHAQMAGSK